MEDFTFANRLNKLIARRHITRKALAAESGVSEPSISQYLSRAREPTIDNLVRLAKALNVSADYLLGLSDVQATDADVQAIHNKTGLDEEAIIQLKGWKREGESDLAQLVSYIASYDKIMLLMSLIDNWLACPADETAKIQGVYMNRKTAIKAALNEESGEALNGYVKWLEGNFDLQTLKSRGGQLGYWQQHGKSWEVANNG